MWSSGRKSTSSQVSQHVHTFHSEKIVKLRVNVYNSSLKIPKNESSRARSRPDTAESEQSEFLDLSLQKFAQFWIFVQIRHFSPRCSQKFTDISGNCRSSPKISSRYFAEEISQMLIKNWQSLRSHEILSLGHQAERRLLFCCPRQQAEDFLGGRRSRASPSSSATERRASSGVTAISRVASRTDGSCGATAGERPRTAGNGWSASA